MTAKLEKTHFGELCSNGLLVWLTNGEKWSWLGQKTQFTLTVRK
ncbi:hypothetical protein D082_20860 [Synechocystis sp. PCC 6714]|nr:hypothetical protein D082_20860 [Synechocystis sp. PCC 6714]